MTGKIVALLLCTTGVVYAAPVCAQMNVWPDPIVQERAFEIPMWITPLVTDSSGVIGRAQRLEEVIYSDLKFTGLFRIVRTAPTSIGMSKSKYSVSVTGRVTTETDGVYFEGRVSDVTSGDFIGGKKYRLDEGSLRRVAHHFADEVVRLVTGEQGVAQTKIVYVRHQKGIWELVLCDYDGYDPHVIIRQRVPLLNPRFADREQAVIYSTYRDGKPDLYIRYLRDSGSQPLATFPGTNSTADWSDRTRLILAALTRDGDSEIYLLEMSGKIRRRLTHNRAIDTSPSWSPGGQELVFVSDRSGTPQLYIMERDGGNVRRLTFTGGYNATPAWSPKGDVIAFVARMGAEFQIATITPDGTDGRLVTKSAGSHEDPRWAPDGRHIAYTERGANDEVISVIDIRTGGKRILAQGANPDWSAP